MSDCYEKGSVIVTTNTEFVRWGTVFGGDNLVAAIMGGLAYHGRLVDFGASGKKMSAALMLGKTEG